MFVKLPELMLISLRNLVPIIISFILTFNLSGQDARSFLKTEFKGYNKEKVLDTLLKASETFAEENPDTALVLGEIAYEMVIQGNEYKSIALASRRIAEAYFYKNEYLRAIDYYMKSAAAEYQNSGDSTGFLAERLTDAAYCYQELGIYEKALELNRASLLIHQKLKNNVEIGNNLCNIGTNYFFRAQYDKAIEYFSKTLELDRESGDSSAIAISLNNLGMVYSRWGKHELALRFYNDALSYTSTESKKAIKLSNIGMAYYHMKEYDRALQFLNDALKIDTKYRQEIKIGIRKNEIGTILAAKGQYDESIRLLEEALEIFKKAGISDSQCIVLSDIGDIYRKTGQKAKAEASYIESAKIASEFNQLQNLGRNYKGLYEMAEEKGDFRKAFTYYKLFTKANDSVFNIQKHEQIARFEILYETGKKEKENQLLLQDIEMEKKAQRVAFIAIIGLSLFVLLILSLYRTKSKNLKQNQLLQMQEQELASIQLQKKETEKRLLEDSVFAEQQINRLEREKHLVEIEHKNAQLANSTLCLVNKNEILGEIREKLKQNHQSDTVHEVLRYISVNTDIDLDWHKFKLSFDEIHPGFFDRLKHEFPYLTDHDERLSAYLRIDLSSREIAGLMNVTLEATNKSRQRLRKKLNLPAEADLNGFLRSL